MPYITSAEQIFREAGLEEGLQKGLQKGRQEGHQEGRKEGRQEGRQEGLHEGLLEGIELGLKLRFGAEGRVLMPEIRAIADVDLLRAIRIAIETATTLEELRRVWA